jgi:uncharacterized protein DUF4920
MRIELGALCALSICMACESGSLKGNSLKANGEVTGSPTVVGSGTSVPSTSAAGPKSTASFGAAFEPGPVIPLPQLLANPAEYADKSVTTEGQVQRACSSKGCWMEIGTGEDACRVTFKDYGFFVPTDSAGARAKIQGRLATRVVEAAAVQHLEAEGARFRNKRADGTATEVRLIASAVQLER